MDRSHWIAWAAGILEGEGCFSICTPGKANFGYKQLAIVCEMTDEDTVYKLRNVFEVGSFRAYPKTRLREKGVNQKDAWRWSVQKHKDIQFVLELIFPYLSERRATRAQELLDYIYYREGLGNKRTRQPYDEVVKLVQDGKNRES